jgi:hypothetical protein
MHFFENELFLITAVQQRQLVDAVRCRKLFSGLIGMFVFGILQIPIGALHFLPSAWLWASF